MKSAGELVRDIFDSKGEFELGDRVIKVVGLILGYSSVKVGIKKEYDDMTFEEVKGLEGGVLFKDIENMIMDKVDISNVEVAIVVTNVLMRLHYINVTSNELMKKEWESVENITRSVETALIEPERRALDMYTQLFMKAYEAGFTKEQMIGIVLEPLENGIVEIIYGRRDKAIAIMSKSQEKCEEIFKNWKGEA